MTNETYITDNSFVNHITPEVDFDVEVVDRSNFESSVLVKDKPKQETKKISLVDKNNGLKNGQLSINTKRMIGGRNAPCPCGSGRKVKKCCGKNI